MSDIASNLLLSAIVSTAWFSVWFGAASYKKRLDFADVAWGGAFVAVVIAQFIAHTDTVTYTQTIVGLCVLIWGLRLMIHIGRRNFSKKEEDPRYTEIRKKWKNFVLLRSYTKIFLLQASLVWLISLPLAAIWQSQLESFWGIAIGLCVWVIGFFFESRGDSQLRNFVSKPSNKGKIMNRGLWRYSRHPNYFGELTQWWGIWLMSLYLNPTWWTILGPLTITFLIRFVSGVPPLEKRYEHNATYQKYKASTNMLVPSPPKKVT